MTIQSWIAEARGRCDAATKGPWESGDGTGRTCWHGEDGVICTEVGQRRVLATLNVNFIRPNDTAFIAHARTDLPKALEAIERLMQFVDHEDSLWGDPSNPAAQARADVERILTRAAKP